MNRNPKSIDLVRLVRRKGSMAFTVLRLPPTAHEIAEEPRILSDIFFMRTASTVEEAIDETSNEFGGYGLESPRIVPDYVTGAIDINDEEIALSPSEKYVRGFNFWVAEGLVGLTCSREAFPRIKTQRQPTRMLYHEWRYLEKPKLSETPLAEIVADTTQMCLVSIASRYLMHSQVSRASRGLNKAADAVVNYGSGHGAPSHLVLFHDPDTDQWYDMLTEECYSKTHRTSIASRGSALPSVRVINQCESKMGFRHLDKVVSYTERSFFFDGSMQDAFLQLEQAGIALGLGVRRE